MLSSPLFIDANTGRMLPTVAMQAPDCKASAGTETVNLSASQEIQNLEEKANQVWLNQSQNTETASSQKQC